MRSSAYERRPDHLRETDIRPSGHRRSIPGGSNPGRLAPHQLERAADAHRSTRPVAWPGCTWQQLAVIVDDYDAAIEFFVEALGFELVEDSPSLTNYGRPKRWVVVRPPGARTGILLALADGGGEQEDAVGRQFAGRVGLFLRVEDFDAAYERMRAAGVEFVGEPRAEPYGRVAVFTDIAGNRWDLLGPA